MINSNLLFFLLFGLSLGLSAQNLFPNASFESTRGTIKQPRYDNMAMPYEQKSGNTAFVNNMNMWYSANFGTPDLRVLDDNYYKACKKRRDDCDQAKEGRHALGIITYMENSRSPVNREYIQAKLTETLTPGETIQVEIWVLSEKWCKLVSNNIGFYFSMKRVYVEDYGPLNVKPQFNYTEVIERKEEWTRIQGSFVADKPYKYVTIGNFYDNEQTKIDEVDVYHGRNNNTPKAYYLIDAAKIYQSESPKEEPIKPVVKMAPKPMPAVKKYKDKTVAVGTTIELKNVEFDTDSYVLKPVSYAEMGELVNWMQSSPTVVIEIRGHTDNVGSDDDNLELSVNRARRVYDYLLSKGIHSSRLTFKGFGERRPISDNQKEEGRRSNRRVEFLILSK